MSKSVGLFTVLLSTDDTVTIAEYDVTYTVSADLSTLNPEDTKVP